MDKMHRMATLAVITTVFLLLPLSVSAQEGTEISLEDMSLEELMNVKVITATKNYRGLVSSPTVINILTEKEIEGMGYQSLQDILEFMTGMSSVNGEGNIFNTITIRGNTLINYNSDILLLLDGIPLYNAYHGSFELSMIPLSAVERIEVIKGANSVLYGTNAISAVINIISKKCKCPQKISTSVEYGSYNTITGSSSVLSSSGKNRYELFINGYNSDGEELPFHDEKGNTAYLPQKRKVFSGLFKFQYENWEADVLYYSRSLPNFRSRGFDVIEEVNGDSVMIFAPQLNEEHGIVVNFQYSKQITPVLNFKARSHHYHWYLKKNFVDDYWDYSSTVLSNELELFYNPGLNNSLIGGITFDVLQAERYKAAENLTDVGKDGNRTLNLSAYVNGQKRILKKTDIYYGTRYFTSFYKDKFTSNISPRVSVSYALTPRFYLKSVFGKSFRVPTYFEKDVNSDKVIGNPTLKPEKSTSYDLVLSGYSAIMRMELDLFYLQIEDKILRDTYAPDPTKKQYQNIGNTYYYGSEFSLNFDKSDKIRGFVTYSYTKGRDEDGDKLPYTYERMLTLGLNYPVKGKLTNFFSLKNLSEWGAAESYILLNTHTVIKPSLYKPFTVHLKIENILNEKIDLPEIARSNEIVPTIPKTRSRMFFLGIEIKL